jgi:uncharacterized protein YndB with AHSA1/START domain
MKAPAHTCTLTTPGDRDIRIERVFDASRDRVWRTFTEPALLAQWWGRGYEMDIDRMEVQYGGHWRFIEYTPRGQQGFEGRYREVRPKERIVRTSEWDGMPGHVMVETETFEDVGADRTRVVTAYLFHTALERDGALGAVEQEIDESYHALDDLLERLH